jgi:hypothetical protein
MRTDSLVRGRAEGLVDELGRELAECAAEFLVVVAPVGELAGQPRFERGDQLVHLGRASFGDGELAIGRWPGNTADVRRTPSSRVLELAWLEFEKPDLGGTERFATALGLGAVSRTPDELRLRGTDGCSACVVVRRGPRSRYEGATFRAADGADLIRLAEATGATVDKLQQSIGGLTVDLTDSSGVPVRGVADIHELATLSAKVADQLAMRSIGYTAAPAAAVLRGRP